MRKLLLFFATFLTLLGIVFTILPLGTIAVLPIIMGWILAFLAFKKSTPKQKQFPKILLIVAAITLLTVAGKEAFIKDEIIVDRKFDEKKIESKKEAQKDLEELEGL